MLSNGCVGKVLHFFQKHLALWLFGPIWVQLSNLLFVLLEYGYLVPNGCSAIIKITVHAPGMWLFWSLMGAIVKNIVHAAGIWLFGPK